MEPKSPAVICQSCARTWNSEAMAEGLRLLGACPRCGGHLEFRDAAGGAAHVSRDPEGETPSKPAPPVAPHLVLGIPRR